MEKTGVPSIFFVVKSFCLSTYFLKRFPQNTKHFLCLVNSKEEKFKVRGGGAFNKLLVKHLKVGN